MNEDELRRILLREAESTEVSPYALEIIQARIAGRRARWWRPRGLVFLGGTAVAAAAAVLAVVLASGSVSRSPAVGPGGLPGTSASASGPMSAGPTANVPVYYLGATSLGPRLYREYHLVPVPDGSPAGKARAAVTEMLSPHSPFDPDYSSPWPGGIAVRDASLADGTVTVDLTGVPPSSGQDKATERMLREQLIWTATAASGTTQLRLLLGGQPVSTLWGMAATGVIERGPRADVYAPVWLIDPQQGVTVGHTFSVYLAGIVPEATVRLRVRNASGNVLSDQSVDLSAGAPALGEARLQLSEVPGVYTVEAYVASLRDGSEQYLDNHVITVR
jgi:hypothetical protein